MYKKNKKRMMNVLIVGTILIWIILLLLKIFIWEFSFNDLLDDITANILGILPPLLIFNFAYEKLTQDISAIEMSEQITETLMSDPETIALFTEEQRRGFINSTISSLVDKRASDMVQGTLDPYLSAEASYNIRSSFDYNIQLLYDIPKNDIFNPEDYFYLAETLQYSIYYLNDSSTEDLPSDFYAGFFFENENLDYALRTGKEKTGCDEKIPFIFRENLKIKEEDLDKIISLSPQELNSFFNTFIKLKIKIDNESAEILKVTADQTGIKVLFHSNHIIKKEGHSVRILFHMPQLWNSEFQVALSDPTYSPKIQLSYQPDKMKVEMYSFFSESIESSVGNALEKDHGMYNVIVTNKWIYPMSGMVFAIKKL
jgi:hypothetical protein